MTIRSDFEIGEFLYGISGKECYKDAPKEGMVFIHNGYSNADGYGVLMGFEDGKIVKSTGWNNFMWGGDVRRATDDEKEGFMRRIMGQDNIGNR